MKKYNYKWNTFLDDTAKLKNAIRASSIDGIVVINRGSLVPGVIISNVLGIPMSIVNFQTRDGNDKEPELSIDKLEGCKNLVIIDDIYDTGKTAKKVCEFIKSKTDAKLSFFAYISLSGNPFFEGELKDVSIDYIKHIKGYDWIVFPWEEI